MNSQTRDMVKRILRHTFSMLNVDYVKLDSRWNYKNVISPYHRIYYIDEGEGEISDAEKTVTLEAGYLYIIPSFTLCNLLCHSYLSQYFVQFFEESPDGTTLFTNSRAVFKVKAMEIDIVNFQRLVAINPGRGIKRSDNPKVYEKHVYYKQYQEMNNSQSLPHFLETQGILFQLVARLSEHEMTYKSNNHFIPVKIIEAMQFITINLHLSLSVSFLATRANQNTEYFSRLFEQHSGTRPMAFITEKRIERAQHIMATSSVSYTEIAELAGFRSLSHFSRTFKKVTGTSPGIYRKRIFRTSS
jgi:AraC family transcriptional regulator